MNSLDLTKGPIQVEQYEKHAHTMNHRSDYTFGNKGKSRILVQTLGLWLPIKSRIFAGFQVLPSKLENLVPKRNKKD